MIIKILLIIALCVFCGSAIRDTLDNNAPERARKWNMFLALISGIFAVLIAVTFVAPIAAWVTSTKTILLWIVGILVGAALCFAMVSESRRQLLLVVAALTAALFFGIVTTSYAEDTTPEPITPPSQPEEVAFTGKFYNDELQNDGNSDNDFNFGYNRYKAAKKADGEIVDWLDQDFKSSIKEDPALAAATMAYADSIIGTRYLGEFYDSAKKDWSLAINNAKDEFIEDPELYSETVDRFIEMLETEADVSVGKVKNYEDQMYMNPNVFTGNANGSPDVIVLKTDQSTGHYLTYSINIKGNKFDINYRTECGYQPTNVEKTMGIKPGKGSNKPGPKDPDPKDPDPKDPDPKDPDPTPDPDKPTGCSDTQTWETSYGQQAEKYTDSKTGGGNSHMNTEDPPVSGTTRIDQDPRIDQGWTTKPDVPTTPPVVPGGNGRVSGDD